VAKFSFACRDRDVPALSARKSQSCGSGPAEGSSGSTPLHPIVAATAIVTHAHGPICAAASGRVPATYRTKTEFLARGRPDPSISIFTINYFIFIAFAHTGDARFRFSTSPRFALVQAKP
jgi:hypothetical protein